MTGVEQPLPSIEQVLAGVDLSEDQRTACARALVERENQMADRLRMAGAQFGMYPQIVAEVFAEVGIGSPVSVEEREMIHAQFVVLMNQMRAEYERQMRENPPENPTV